MSQVTKEIEFLKKLLFKIYKTVDAQFIIYVEKPEEKQNCALTITANASNLAYVVYKGANALNLVYLEHKAGIFLFSIASFISVCFHLCDSKMWKSYILKRFISH